MFLCSAQKRLKIATFAVAETDRMNNTNKERIKELRAWAKDNLQGKIIEPENIGKNIEFTTKGIKEYLNQPHKHYQEKNELIKQMPEIINNATYMGRTAYHKESNYIVASHIFETKVNGEKTWLIARENKEGSITFYSISDSEKVLLGIKK